MKLSKKRLRQIIRETWDEDLQHDGNKIQENYTQLRAEHPSLEDLDDAVYNAIDDVGEDTVFEFLEGLMHRHSKFYDEDDYY